MDEDFAFFLDNFGPAIERKLVPELSIARYKNKLPKQLLDYWSAYGWCGYAGGLLWTVNPHDYDHVLDQWLAATSIHKQDSYHVIARSAFGILYIWGENSGYCLTLNSYISRYSARTSIFIGDNLDFGVKAFFSSMIAEYNDLDDLFKPALKSLGPLKHDEMYGFVPALALGGPMELKNLQKVKTIEHLTFLSQLSPLQDWGFPDV
ncbi:GAD-like domain-containing protein [Pseudomonas syringae pv. actinidiae]|uniref:Glutamyl-tRNA amidotransferase n=1 Tax=Pseudomonas syringae pv. actinidiae TaxID=103796 RepID=A0AAN4TP87_PSESF|nr:GAD-like domain-containing protein [Pseudomonas syringae]AKT33051.1 glutamyl-tRNA amidotransferase [Pseudomonas syringae pv. actinidiae ICMP 18884]AOE60120.1 glutamyl-tRNA amidotransferase [Pseudomonas syringae pv. actinidiae ICMP 18708]APQ01089.1 glutamyl-tRNA amidotransferase [Pseudomonas syringae pv. actinidiae]APQ06826.1 glutamyl-tRNA amidotransferase [Pseudomonas syringae pv. actinidiae]AQX62494.1 glutamyl-tRNA amidotransferase [Pseudomonas syringae pv. actinidiae]